MITKGELVASQASRTARFRRTIDKRNADALARVSHDLRYVYPSNDNFWWVGKQVRDYDKPPNHRNTVLLFKLTTGEGAYIYPCLATHYVAEAHVRYRINPRQAFINSQKKEFEKEERELDFQSEEIRHAMRDIIKFSLRKARKMGIDYKSVSNLDRRGNDEYLLRANPKAWHEFQAMRGNVKPIGSK